MELREILMNHLFKKVALKINTGAKLVGYIVDVKLPVATGLAVYFLEENKAKRYLAKYNPTWLMPLPIDMIEEIKDLAFDEISDGLENRRIALYN